MIRDCNLHKTVQHSVTGMFRVHSFGCEIPGGGDGALIYSGRIFQLGLRGVGVSVKRLAGASPLSRTPSGRCVDDDNLYCGTVLDTVRTHDLAILVCMYTEVLCIKHSFSEKCLEQDRTYCMLIATTAASYAGREVAGSCFDNLRASHSGTHNFSAGREVAMSQSHLFVSSCENALKPTVSEARPASGPRWTASSSTSFLTRTTPADERNMMHVSM